MSERSDIQARYDEHRINGRADAWDLAVSELGGEFGHYKLVNGEVETTSLYDTEQAKIKAKQEEYDAWLESGSTNATNDANAKTTTSTSATSNIQDNSTATGGGYTDTKTNYISEDTPESLTFKANAATIAEQENALLESMKGSGVSTRNHPDYSKLKQLRASRRAAENAAERSQKHTTTQTTTYHDADGNKISEADYTVSHTKDINTGEVKNVQVGNAIVPVVQLTQADADKLNANSEYAPRTLADLQDEANDDAYLASLPTYNGIQFQNQQALDEYKANNVVGNEVVTTNAEAWRTEGAKPGHYFNDMGEEEPITGAFPNEPWRTEGAPAGQYFNDMGELEPIPASEYGTNGTTTVPDSTAGLVKDPTSPDYGCSVDEIYDDANMMCVPKPSTHDEAVQMGCDPLTERYDDANMMCVPLDNNSATDTNGQVDAEPTPEPSVSELRQNKAHKDDWRVRLRLAPQSDYLYNAQDPGILAPLAETDGIIFPYMPRIDTVHQARYNNYDLPHSNYRGYFYAGSHQERVIVSATFTAQDTKEANYMLAALHFLRSCTKMFYGQDAQRGTPPPLVFLSGLGEHQFNEHPCAVEIVNINLPNDVDYIKAGNGGTFSGDFMSPLTASKSNTTPSFGSMKSSISRLFGSGLKVGGTPAPTYTSENIFKADGDGTTMMPTKMDINFNLIPIQTRDQVSNEYSLKDYASGSLLKKGFW